MFGRKKPEPAKRANRGDLSQYGLFEIPDDVGMNDDGGDSGGDSDLENELAAITSGGQSRPRAKPKPKLMPAANLDRLVADSLRDIGSDEEMSGDEDDPDLLSELSGIVEPDEDTEETPVAAPVTAPSAAPSIVQTIQTRIGMYKTAIENATSANDSSKVRRFNRGLKTLNDQLKQAKAGRPINPDDIPPDVSTKIAPPPSQSPQESDPTENDEPAAPITPVTEQPVEPPVAVVDTVGLDIVKARQAQYKLAALEAKKNNEMPTAIQYIKIVKRFDFVIQAMLDGKPVDLSDMPPDLTIQIMEQPAVEDPPKSDESMVQRAAEEPNDEPTEEILITANTVGEALQQRLDKYKSVERSANEEGNSGKARRFGRIIKQYEAAIKAHKSGKPVQYDELPCPPGYGPLPVPGSQAKPEPTRPAPPAPPATSPSPSSSQGSPNANQMPKSPPTRPPLQKQDSTRIGGNHVNTSVMNSQIQELLQRQTEFKQAAINAKKAGEIEQAKEYLKIYKGLENLLGAARGGLPVDMATVPISPFTRASLEDSFVLVGSADANVTEDDLDLTQRLEQQLQKQLTMCKTTRDHHRALGDVAGMNRFENLAVSVQKDLDVLRLARRKNLAVPKFHYEQKSFNIVKCNTDLIENEVEVTVARGINYNVANPKDVDTYVKVEFPYPTDDPFRTKTQLIKNTDNPEYNSEYRIEIQRSNRQCQRVFKRQSAKFEIYSKGGFLRSDTLIGTVLVKLQPLETACEIHETFNLMDGRKSVGGKLEVKIRIRNPILAKLVEKLDEKWLIIDS